MNAKWPTFGCSLLIGGGGSSSHHVTCSLMPGFSQVSVSNELHPCQPPSGCSNTNASYASKSVREPHEPPDSPTLQHYNELAPALQTAKSCRIRNISHTCRMLSSADKQLHVLSGNMQIGPGIAGRSEDPRKHSDLPAPTPCFHPSEESCCKCGKR